MEAGELHELVERVESIEREHHPRIRTLVTILIPVVTVLTALTSLFAARANGHAVVAQRARANDIVAAERAGEDAAEQIGRYNDINTASWDAYRRSVIENRQAATLSGSSAALLRTQASRWATTQTFYNKQLNAFDLPSLQTAGTLDQQRAFEAGQVGQEWVDKEDSDIGLAGLFAVALFLLGLTMTLPRASVKWGFIGVACLLAVIGIIRMVLVNVPGVHQTPAGALADYSNALKAEQATSNGDSSNGNTAVSQLTAATRLDPDYGQAWLALGEARDGSSSPDSAAAVEDYRRAIELDQGSASAYNNLSYDEVLLGRYGQAAADADSAHALQPSNPFIDMTRAEAALGSGDLAAATHWRDVAVGVLSNLDSSFRDSFFAQLRVADIPSLTRAGLPSQRVQQLFGPLRNVEASLDAFGSPTPRPLDGATLSGLHATYYKPRALYLMAYTANNVHAGDIVSIRVYDDSTEQYSIYSSYPKYPLTTSGTGRLTAKTPIDKGQYRIELYLNGNFQTSITVNSPGD